MSNDKPELPEKLIPINEPVKFNIDNIDISKFNIKPMSNFTKPIVDIVEPPSMEERLKPITERQDKTITTLNTQIDVYRAENQSLKSEIETISLQLQEERMRREVAEAKQELAETMLGAKDWKIAIISLLSAVLILAVEHWRDIYDAILYLIGLRK